MAENVGEKLRKEYVDMLMAPTNNDPDFFGNDVQNQAKWYTHCADLLHFSKTCDGVSGSEEAKELSDEAKDRILRFGHDCIEAADLEMQYGHSWESASWLRTAIKIYGLIPNWKNARAKIKECETRLNRSSTTSTSSTSSTSSSRVSVKSTEKRRSGKMIGLGVFLFYVSVYGFVELKGDDVRVCICFGALALTGLLLFIFGMRKKKR